MLYDFYPHLQLFRAALLSAALLISYPYFKKNPRFPKAHRLMKDLSLFANHKKYDMI